MAYFYNGRLHITPATMSAVDDSAMANLNLTVGNVLAILGPATGGQPNTALEFSNPADAVAAFRSGDLLDCILAAFDPSPQTNAPGKIIGIRVNPAVQSSLGLLDAGGSTVIALKSTDYGAYTNGIRVKIESGSTAGKKLTTQLGGAYYSQDNIYRNALSVQYTGAQVSATITIANNSITLAAPAGTTVATVDLNVDQTIQQVVDRINTIAGFTASVVDDNGAKPALNGLDNVSAQDVKTAAYTVTGTLQAIVDWFNGQGEGYVTATRMAIAGTLPANIPFTYLSGGSDGVITNTEWSNAFTTLQQSDVQWITEASGDTAIHAMGDAHCAFMTVNGKERRAIHGTVLNTTDDVAITEAKGLNSDRSSLVHIGHYDYNAAGKLTLYAPFRTAAKIAGGFAGSNPGTSMTNKAIKCRGWERKLNNPVDTDKLILGGVIPVEDTPKGYKVTQSITTWQVNDNYNRVEISTGVALDYTVRNVRDALDDMRGKKGGPLTLEEAEQIADTVLRELAKPEPEGPGVLAGDAKNPPYKGLKASLVGDVMGVSFQCSPVIPINYVAVTVYAVPYSGTVSA